MWRLLLPVAVVALGLGCAAATRDPGPRPDSRSRSQVKISAVRSVGPYLDARIRGERLDWRFFFPRSAACEALLLEGSAARYYTHGPFGVLRNDAGDHCEPVGVGSLTKWRDEQPRRRSKYLVPRVQAAFRLTHAAEHLLLARGRFPLALEVRWPEPMDTIAALPARPECRELLERDTATMEFHAAGPDAFVLEAEGTRCPIVGFALPLAID